MRVFPKIKGVLHSSPTSNGEPEQERGTSGNSVAAAFYNVPTRYFSPVGEGTPPAGSMVTAIATGCGMSGGVLNVSLKLPCASGVSNPALIGAWAVTTHS